MSLLNLRLTILLIEDDARSAREKEKLFSDFSIDTVLTGDIETAIEIGRLHRPDAVVASSAVGKPDAITMCRQIQASADLCDCPLLVYTRRYSPLEAALLLEQGVSDYTGHAILAQELVARVRRMVKRSEPKRPKVLKVGDISIDGDACEITFRGRPVDTTPTEFRILQGLAGEPGTVFSRQRIANLAGLQLFDTADRTIDAHVKNVRRKLGPGAAVLQTVRGFGYRMSG